jgi:hypothetical protein
LGEQAAGGPTLAELIADCAGFFEMRHQQVRGMRLVLMFGSRAMIFRLRWPWCFTLRSLFVVTTLPAVVLGMIAWLDRAWIGK